MVSRRVLVVDDVTMERTVVVDILTRAGHRVTEASSAEQAIEIARTMRPQPEAIFMDVVMHPINGFEACRTLSRDPTTQHIPILMCTSKEGNADKSWAKRQGAVEYLIKPVQPSAVLAKLERAISKKKTVVV